MNFIHTSLLIFDDEKYHETIDKDLLFFQSNQKLLNIAFVQT